MTLLRRTLLPAAPVPDPRYDPGVAAESVARREGMSDALRCAVLSIHDLMREGRAHIQGTSAALGLEEVSVCLTFDDKHHAAFAEIEHTPTAAGARFGDTRDEYARCEVRGARRTRR